MRKGSKTLKQWLHHSCPTRGRRYGLRHGQYPTKVGVAITPRYDCMTDIFYFKFTSNSKKVCEKMKQFETILKSIDFKNPRKIRL